MSIGWIIFIGFILFAIYVEYSDRKVKKEKIIQLKKDIDWLNNSINAKEELITKYNSYHAFSRFRGINEYQR